MQQLLSSWKERLRRFQQKPEVAKGMDESTAMGVQHGRTVCLQQCIEELEENMANSLMVIAPYLYQGIWVFDDPDVGLVKEALVAGVPEIIERLCVEQNIPNPQDGFRIVFSAVPFPGHHLEATWVREGDGGNWYSAYGGTMEGWLCPALFKYFEKAPEKLYLQVLPKA